MFSQSQQPKAFEPYLKPLNSLVSPDSLPQMNIQQVEAAESLVILLKQMI